MTTKILPNDGVCQCGHTRMEHSYITEFCACMNCDCKCFSVVIYKLRYYDYEDICETEISQTENNVNLNRNAYNWGESILLANDYKKRSEKYNWSSYVYKPERQSITFYDYE